MRPSELKQHNRPPHIHTEPGYYFITCRTLEGQWFLQPDRYKELFLGIIREKVKKFNLPLIAYAILHNHYHSIWEFKNPAVMSKFMAELNGASSKAINEADHVIGRKIWWNYFEHLVTTEKDFFSHLNYIHQNPIKHGLTKVFSYQFSSYDSWVKKKGQEYLDDSFRKYPIIDFKVRDDEF